jgi:hypothetical protein
MRVFDPTLTTIPSFRLRATARLAELARLSAALTYTEGWDSLAVEELLRDARRLRHGLRTLQAPGLLTLDEQRFVCERLLPIVGEAASAPAPVLVPAKVTIRLTQKAPFFIGLSSELLLTITVGANLPAGAQLVLLRDKEQLGALPAQPGEMVLSDTPVGEDYVAQLWYNNQLLGAATLHVVREYPVRWGVLPVGTTSVTDQSLAAFEASASALRLPLTFSVKAGRGHLAIVIPPNYKWAVKDPRLNTDLSASFRATEQVLNVVGVGQVPVVLLRQQTPVIGPFSFPAILELT